MSPTKFIKLTALSIILIPSLVSLVSAAPAQTSTTLLVASGQAADSAEKAAPKPATKAAHGVASKASVPKPVGGASLEGLKKIDNAWEILDNPTARQSMKSVMGDKYVLFEQCTQQLNQPENSGDEVFAAGGIEGLYTISESAFSFNTKSKRMQVAILSDNSLNIWGAANDAALSRSMQSFIADLRDRRHESDPADKMTLKFEAPNQSSIAVAKSERTEAPKNLKVSTPTGTYERKSKWDDATLQVKSLGANKIKFTLQAAHAANSGEAEGVINMQDNKGIYKNDEVKLQFKYGGKSFSITQIGDGQFGGMGVYADGLYVKTSDKTPDLH